MKQTQTLKWELVSLGEADLGSWRAAFASLVPLWLVTLAVACEGFPRPPIPVELALPALGLGIVLGILLLVKGWMTFELALYSFIPFVFLIPLDEITTAYKTPFLFACAAILSLGILGYQRSLHRDSVTAGWIILLAAAVLAITLTLRAGTNFWKMQDDMGIGMCFLDYTGCPALTGNETPWWRLFLGV